MTGLSKPKTSQSTPRTIQLRFALPFRQGGTAAGDRMIRIQGFAILRSTALYRSALRDFAAFVLICREIRTAARYICISSVPSSWRNNKEMHI